MDDEQTTMALERLAAQITAPMPAAASFVAQGTVLVRRRRRWRMSAAAAVAVLILVSATLLSGVGTDQSRVDTASSPGVVVTSVEQVSGGWLLVRVHGGPPPPDVVRDVTIQPRDASTRRLVFEWDDTVNLISEDAYLGKDDRLHFGSVTSTAVGCVSKRGGPCEEAGGIGLEDGHQMRLDHGDLILVDAGGNEVAAYQR